jgi:hypothetical protein
MGIFGKKDKKQKDDFDSQIDASDLDVEAPPSTAIPASAAEASRAEATLPPLTRPMAKEARAVHDDYGIEKAIELMRTLPTGNVELVVQVVKASLESVGIKLPTIITDAVRRQERIQTRIGVLRSEIAKLEEEIRTRKQEIERLEADHRETSMVRERLELAESMGGARPAAPVAPAPTPTPAPEPAAAAAAPATASAAGGTGRFTRLSNPPGSGSSTK